MDLQQAVDETKAAWEQAQQALEEAKVAFYAAYPDGGHAQEHAGDTPESWAAYVSKRKAVTDAHDAEIVARGAYSVAVHNMQMAAKAAA